MLKDRLNSLDINITELAGYLGISRPTMYKYINNYDENNKININKSVLTLFDYINDNPYIGKNNVTYFILDNMMDIKDMESVDETKLYKNVRKYMINNPESEKSKFLDLCCKTTSYDKVIHYLIEITPLLKIKKLSDEKKALLKPFQDIIGLYTEKGGEV